MRIRVGLPALAIALVLGADVYVLTQQDRSTAVTLEQAVDHFRATVPDGVSDQAPAPTTATTAATAPPASPAGTDGQGRAGEAAARSRSTPGAGAPATAEPFTVPDEGVYAYRTTGFEEVSLGGGRHDYPSRSFASVRRRGGCDWDVEHQILEEHVERSVHCSAPGRFMHSEEQVEVEFYGQKEGSTYRCEPPMVVAQVGDAPGTKRSTTCRSDDGQAVQTTTFLGRERLSVGGSAVDALHVLFEAVISGRAEGTSRNETWIHPDTGLLLKAVRTSQSRAKAFGTTVDYHEEATFELERLAPVR